MTLFGQSWRDASGLERRHCTRVEQPRGGNIGGRMRQGPLSGIRVLDTTRALAGPLCTMTLGDLGADVIKIEMPDGGYEARRWAIPQFGNDSTPTMLAYNRNKRSVALDLHTEEGRQTCLELASTCDVFVENFRPGTIGRFGLGYEAMVKVRPDIIYCSLSGYGQKGPLAKRPANDLMLQAVSGLMSLTGEPDGRPIKAAAPIADTMGGFSAIVSILGAIIDRMRTGKGRFLDIAMLDGMIALQGQAAAGWGMGGDISKRFGNGHPFISPYESFSAADREIVVSVTNNKAWFNLVKLPEMEPFRADERFATQPLRNRYRDILVPALQAVFRTREAAYWVEALNAVSVPTELINTLPEILASEQTAERAMLMDIEYPPGSANHIRIAGMPWKDVAAEGSPLSPPTLGQHTQEVLEELARLKAKR